MAEPTKVGVVGCGAISKRYFTMAAQLPTIEIVACADLFQEKAQERADEFGCEVSTLEDILADDRIEILLNLTVPKAHAPVAKAALEAGKHTYAEKPLGINREEGREVYDLAQAKGLRMGCAPDTVLGAGIQTARKVLDEGAIGRPIGFTAFMMGHGPESWHPSPEFYYEVGGGPMLDMGPYYLTALLNLLGPVERVMGEAIIALPERTITSEPKYGKKVTVETPDHIGGTLKFANGAAGTLITSFATWHATYDRNFPITIFGEDGTLKVPDPNRFDGEVQVRGEKDEEWRTVPHAFPTGYERGIGLADMADALRTGRPHRCSAEQAFLCLELMTGFLTSADTGQAVSPTVAYERPAPMPQGVEFGVTEG